MISRTVAVAWVAERGTGPLDALVACARAGDARAFRDVTQELGPPLTRYVTYFLRGDADTASDVVQDTFITAWRKIDTIRDGDHLRPWLYRVARFKAISWLRRRGPRGTPMDSIERAQDGGYQLRASRAHEPTPPSSRVERLQAAIAKLPPIYAGAIKLHYLHGCDTRTTGELLGIPRTTVKMRLHRGRKKLRELMEEPKTDKRR